MSTRNLAELNERAWGMAKEDPAAAMRHAREAVAAAEKLGDRRALGLARRTQGACLLELGELSEAAPTLADALSLLGAVPDSAVALSQTHRLLARLGFLQQDFRSALRHAHHALKSCHETSDVLLTAAALNDAGMIYAHLGSYQEGLDYMLKSLTVLEEAGVPPAGGPLNNIGNVYLLQGEAERALAYFERALGAFEVSGTRRERLIAQGNIGRALENLGELDRAVTVHEDCVKLVREAGDVTYLPPTLTKYGVVLTRLGRTDEAFACLNEALALGKEASGSFRDETIYALASLQLQVGVPEEAEPLFRSALDGAIASDNRQTQAVSHLGLSEALESLGRPKEALEHYRRYHELNVELTRELYSNQTQALLLHNEIEQANRERQLLQDTNLRLSTAYDELRAVHEALAAKSTELERLSLEDPLTKLPNRRELEGRLIDELSRKQRFGSTFSVVMCDIDDFKAINDRYSHMVGDEILVHFGELLRRNIRSADAVARLGGEEFILLLPGTGLADARRVAEKIRQAVAAFPWGEQHPELAVTLSAGVTEALEGEDVTTILKRADKQLYRAKRMGKNVVCCGPDQEFSDRHLAESPPNR